MTIRTKNSRVISRVLSLILIVIFSCDSFNDEDVIPTDKQVTFNENVFYILPGSSVVIDLNAIVKQSFTHGSLSISQDPLRGRISRLDGQFLKYKPAAGFTEGEDEFVISAANIGTVLKSDTVTIIMVQNEDDLPCPLYAIEDKVQVKPGSPISISFLENDRLCGTGSAQVSIQLNPQFGEATLIGDSAIVYSPGAAFTGRDQLVYKLSSASDGAISYGVIALSNSNASYTSKIKTLKTPDNLNIIFFVDENIGFLAGIDENLGASQASRIYKTVDGGETWNMLSHLPFNPYGYCFFNDIFFLDANNGFATYYSCAEEDTPGGLISTTDGGLSWKKLNFDLPIASVFFTSATTGFIGVNLWEPFSKQINKFFKTEDGGSTWRETYLSPLNPTHNYFLPRLGIQFNDSLNGYALLSEYWDLDKGADQESSTDNLYVTSDAGESWTLAASNKVIFSVALAPENIATAVFGLGQDGSATVPSSIVRSDNATWHTVADFPYPITHHKFSHSGDLGIAVGVSSSGFFIYDTLSQVMAINKSVDKGATWVKEVTDEPIYGRPWAIAVPSNNVAYILCGIGYKSKLIKYTR